jgi:hypothetical protein
VLRLSHGADEQVGSVLSIRVLENHVFLGTRIDRKISARDVFFRRVAPAHLLQAP